MAKKNHEALDPTLPFTEIAIGGNVYKMCLDHGALCEAESQLLSVEVAVEGKPGQTRQLYPEVNLLYILPNLTGANSRILFAMSLRKFHPEIPYEDALKLVTNMNSVLVASKVMTIYQDSTPEAAEGASSDPQ